MLELTEYLYAAARYGALPGMAYGTALVTQEVAVGAASAQSAAFADSAQMIELIATVDCRIAIGPAPVAANAGAKTRLIKANVEYRFAVTGGDKLAVIAAT